MQSRFWISTHPTHEAAVKAREELLIKAQGGTYQIRKGRDSSGIIFRLVERLTRNEAEVVNERHQPTGYKLRRSKRQRREREINSIL